MEQGDQLLEVDGTSLKDKNPFQVCVLSVAYSSMSAFTPIVGDPGVSMPMDLNHHSLAHGAAGGINDCRRRSIYK